MRRAGSATAVLAVVACLACGGHRSDGEVAAFRPLDVGAPVPAYTTESLTGDTIRVGGREPATVLNVWATWCTSCAEEMAALDSLQHEFGRDRLRVIGVSVDNGDVERVRRFAEANHLDFIVAHDPAGDIQRTYALVGVPTTFVIAPDGTLLWRHTGNIGDTFDDARAAVRKALTAAQ